MSRLCLRDHDKDGVIIGLRAARSLSGIASLARGWACILAVALWATASTNPRVSAQQLQDPYAVQAELVAARADASATARLMEVELALLVPKVEGLTCGQFDPGGRLAFGWEEPLPRYSFRCAAGGVEIVGWFLFADPPSTLLCRAPELERQRVARAETKPKRSRLFETQHWSLVRTVNRVIGCAEDLILFNAEVTDDRGDLDAGIGVLDRLTEAVIERDPRGTVATYDASGHADKLDRVSKLMQLQTDHLDAIVRGLEDIEEWSLVDTSGSKRPRPLHFPMNAMISPYVFYKARIDECWISVVVGAGPNTVYEARYTGKGWADRYPRSGETREDWERRVTERFVMEHPNSKSSIMALVDDAVVVSLSIPNKESCAAYTQIPRKQFEELLRYDFKPFQFQP